MGTRYRGAIVDIDGTLIDSNDAHAESWVEVLSETGRVVRFEDVRRLIGMGGDRILMEVAGIPEDTDEGQRLSARRRKIFLERHLPSLRPFPGARELLLRLREAGLRLAVGTSANEEELGPLLRQADVHDLFDEETTSSDVEISKPSPDVVQKALRKLGLPPSEVVFLGDTPYDVEAGRRAGVDVIALRTGGWPDEALRDAVALYDGPVDLVLHLESSPLSIGEEARPALF